MKCSNYCKQGRQPCPTPYTCGLADKSIEHRFDGEFTEDHQSNWFDDLKHDVLIILAVVSVTMISAFALGYVWVKLFK